MTLREKLRRLSACKEALIWLGDHDLTTAWAEVPGPGPGGNRAEKGEGNSHGHYGNY